MTLTVWTAAEFASSADVLTQQLEEFEAASPKVRVAIQLKGMEGKGGLVNLLTTAAPVAPSALPDVAIVNGAQARALAQRGLIHPWQGLLPPDSKEGLFSLAQRLEYQTGEWMSAPLALDVQHLAYNSNRVPKPPLLWQNVLTGEELYLFPARGEGEGLDTFLLQYIEDGGKLSDEEGKPWLEEETLNATLARYRRLRTAEVLPPEAVKLDSLRACWPLYLSDRASMVHVWASHYLAERAKLRGTSFAPVPAAGETHITLGRGWLMVLVTGDPARQEEAARLLNWWLTPQNNASFCRATGWLPPTHPAFEQWQKEDDRYHHFLEGRLKVAVPQPVLPASWAEALSKAIGQVLGGELTAQEAAAQVMAVVRGG